MLLSPHASTTVMPFSPVYPKSSFNDSKMFITLLQELSLALNQENTSHRSSSNSTGSQYPKEYNTNSSFSPLRHSVTLLPHTCPICSTHILPPAPSAPPLLVSCPSPQSKWSRWGPRLSVTLPPNSGTHYPSIFVSWTLSTFLNHNSKLICLNLRIHCSPWVFLSFLIYVLLLFYNVRCPWVP